MVKKRRIGGSILAAAILVTSLAACGGNATPTLSPEMVYTQAAQTVAAGLTQTAVLMPTATSTPTLQPTNTPGPTNTPTITLAVTTSVATIGTGGTKPTVPDKAEWIGQTPGDGTTFTPGEDFTLTWTVKNTGTTTWTTGYQLRFYLGDSTLRFAASDIKLPKEVKPNESVDLSLKMEAPHNSGDYTTIWVLTTPEGANFYPLTFNLKVSGSQQVPSTATVTSTP